MSYEEELIERLMACPPGKAGWQEFENVCVEALKFLFVPPLRPPHIQPRTESGVERRDAVFPNWNYEATNHWGILFKALNANIILFEFKNYEKTEIGSEEVVQTHQYLRDDWGKLAFLVCNKEPSSSARITRNNIYHEKGGIVILFITSKDIEAMIIKKQKGEDPADVIMDLYDLFRISRG